LIFEDKGGSDSDVQADQDNRFQPSLIKMQTLFAEIIASSGRANMKIVVRVHHSCAGVRQDKIAIVKIASTADEPI
jgi:hypothetical protein